MVEFIQTHPDDPSYVWYVRKGNLCTRNLASPNFVLKMQDDLIPRMQSQDAMHDNYYIHEGISLKKQSHLLASKLRTIRPFAKLDHSNVKEAMTSIRKSGVHYDRISNFLTYLEEHPVLCCMLKKQLEYENERQYEGTLYGCRFMKWFSERFNDILLSLMDDHLSGVLHDDYEFIPGGNDGRRAEHEEMSTGGNDGDDDPN